MKRSGFTLIELLVVISILGIMFLISIPNFSRFASQISLNASAKTLASELRALQSKAVLEHKTLSFDPGSFALPAGIETVKAGSISFSPSGFTAFGGSGSLFLQNRFGQQKKVVVSWSGRVRIE
ncbi:MAG: prepilin-type N-terminal cleavage/methylation domain-containing protein [Candidatus Margulisiibacteriota bacterium]